MANRLAQPIAVPTQAPDIPLGSVPLLPKDTGGAEYYGAIESKMNGLASEIGAVADRAAAVEGKQAGYEAGMDPEFRPNGEDFTIRGQAFNASAVATYELNMKTAIATKAQTIADQFAQDPKGMQGAFAQLAGEYKNDNFPQMAPIAAAQIEGYRLSAVRSATRNAEAAATAARKDALQTSMAAQFSALDRATYGLGLDEKSDQVIAGQLEGIRQSLSGAAARGDITRDAAARALQQAEATVASARILGAFDRLQSPAAQQQFAAELGQRYAKSEGDFAGLDPASMQKLQATIAGRLKATDAQVNVAAKELDARIDSMTAAAKQGLVPPPDAMAGLRAQVALIGDQGLAAKAAIAEHVLSLTELGRKMTPAELDGTIAGINKTMTEKGATAEALELRDSAAGLLKTMRDAIGNDPLGWADRVGAVKVAPLDLTKPDTLAPQMQQRALAADTVAKYYGIKPVYLTPAESDAFSRVASQGGAPMLTVAKAIADGFGPRAGAVFDQLGQNAPVLAHVGNLLAQPGAEPFAQDVAQGLSLKAQESLPAAKQTMSLPNWLKSAPDKMLTAQTAEIRTVYGDAFALSGDAGLAAQESARQAFNWRAVSTGLDAANPDGKVNKAFDMALQQAAGARFAPDGTQYGGVTSIRPGIYNSYRVLVPPDIKASSFGKVIGAITDADLAALPAPPAAADGKAYSARDLHNAVPVAVRGGYRFALGEPGSDNPKWLRGGDGLPFVLDLDALRPALQKRLPDAFLGGR